MEAFGCGVDLGPAGGHPCEEPFPRHAKARGPGATPPAGNITPTRGRSAARSRMGSRPSTRTVPASDAVALAARAGMWLRLVGVNRSLPGPTSLNYVTDTYGGDPA